MSFPNTEILPRGTKLKILREQERRSITDRLLFPVPQGEIVTVLRDFGAGKILVWVPSLNTSEMLYLWDSDAERIA